VTKPSNTKSGVKTRGDGRPSKLGGQKSRPSNGPRHAGHPDDGLCVVCDPKKTTHAAKKHGLKANGFPPHPAAECFPLMSESRLLELAADIQARGLIRSVVLFEGKILDGRNRLRACELANVEPTFTEWNGDNPYRYVWSENAQRRDLDVAQREAIAILIERNAKAWDKINVKRETGRRQSEAARSRPRKDDGTLRANGGSHDPQLDRNHAKDRHLESPSRRRMEEVERHDPKLLERVARGEVKGMEALRQVKRATLSTRLAALPTGKHRVIYADPPWKYGDERTGLGGNTEIGRVDSAAASHYPTMPVGDICALDVKSLAADDSVLFLWATFPLLDDGLAVIKAWGFDYKTAFVWDKQRSNVGNYHDARAEILLIGTRGSCLPEIDTRPPQVQSIARGKHSAKPEAFRELIDRMYPSGPRVELFRRGTAPVGWTVWGNEASTEAA
jgi:N6-adenosine-specific RNA methylase IME4